MNKAGKIIEKMLSDPNQRTDLIKFHKAVEKYNSEKPSPTKQLMFEHFLRDNSKDGIEFRLVVTKKDKCCVEFYCHPLGRDGTTYDGYASKFTIHPKNSFDNLLIGLINLKKKDNQMTKAEEYLKSKRLNFNQTFNNGQKYVAKLLTDFAKEMCEEQREICGREFIKAKEEMLKERKDNVGYQFTQIVSAPSPLEGGKNVG